MNNNNKNVGKSSSTTAKPLKTAWENDPKSQSGGGTHGVWTAFLTKVKCILDNNTAKGKKNLSQAEWNERAAAAYTLIWKFS